MPQADRLLSAAEAEQRVSAPASCSGQSSRALCALAIVAVLSVGTIIGLLVEVANDEDLQAHALAPPTHGAAAMHYCIVVDCAEDTQGLPDQVTAALKKGCTLVGGVSHTQGARGMLTAMQAMLCPSAMVGSTAGRDPPYDLCEQKGNGGNLGLCLVQPS